MEYNPRRFGEFNSRRTLSAQRVFPQVTYAEERKQQNNGPQNAQKPHTQFARDL